MLGKVLMCPCYVEYFYQEWNEYVKKLFHFSTFGLFKWLLKKWIDKMQTVLLFFQSKGKY